MFLDSKYSLYNSIIVFIFIVIILYLLKPEFIYSKRNKKFKQFGLKENETIFPFPFMTIGMGIVFYFIFSTLEQIDKNSNN